MRHFSRRKAVNNQHLQFAFGNTAFLELQRSLLIYPEGMHLGNIKVFLTLL